MCKVPSRLRRFKLALRSLARAVAIRASLLFRCVEARARHSTSHTFHGPKPRAAWECECFVFRPGRLTAKPDAVCGAHLGNLVLSLWDYFFLVFCLCPRRTDQSMGMRELLASVENGNPQLLEARLKLPPRFRSRSSCSPPVFAWIPRSRCFPGPGTGTQSMGSGSAKPKQDISAFAGFPPRDCSPANRQPCRFAGFPKPARTGKPAHRQGCPANRHSAGLPVRAGAANRQTGSLPVCRSVPVWPSRQTSVNDGPVVPCGESGAFEAVKPSGRRDGAGNEQRGWKAAKPVDTRVRISLAAPL